MATKLKTILQQDVTDCKALAVLVVLLGLSVAFCLQTLVMAALMCYGFIV